MTSYSEVISSPVGLVSLNALGATEPATFYELARNGVVGIEEVRGSLGRVAVAEHPEHPQ
jgi:hypothetical protein